VMEFTDIDAPRGLLITDDGSIIVADAKSGRLLRLRKNRRSTVAKDLAPPVALLADTTDSVLVSEYGRGALTRVNLRDGSRQIIATQLPTSLAALSFSADTTTGLVATRDGRLYITCAENNSILRIDP